MKVTEPAMSELEVTAETLTDEEVRRFRDSIPGPTSPYRLRKRKELVACCNYALEKMPFGSLARERWEATGPESPLLSTPDVGDIVT